MARCVQLSPTDSQRWTQGDAWDSRQIEEEVIDTCDRQHIHEPVVVVNDQHQILFALTWKGVRA